MWEKRENNKHGKGGKGIFKDGGVREEVWKGNVGVEEGERERSLEILQREVKMGCLGLEKGGYLGRKE